VFIRQSTSLPARFIFRYFHSHLKRRASSVSAANMAPLCLLVVMRRAIKLVSVLTIQYNTAISIVQRVYLTVSV